MNQTVLGFDTSGGWCSAAVTREKDVLAHRHVEMAKGQAETLMPLIEDVLAEAGVDWPALTAIGVGVGPGNFTGIRISVSAARGLAMGLGIPAIGVNRFDAIALDGPKLPVVVPAIRSQVWVQSPGEAPYASETQPNPALGGGDGLIAPVHPLAVAIAQIALARLGTDQPRPAPLYLREADAAPPSEAPPALIE